MSNPALTKCLPYFATYDTTSKIVRILLNYFLIFTCVKKNLSQFSQNFIIQLHVFYSLVDLEFVDDIHLKKTKKKINK